MAKCQSEPHATFSRYEETAEWHGVDCQNKENNNNNKEKC